MFWPLRCTVTVALADEESVSSISLPRFGSSSAIAAYVSIAAMISLVALWLLPDYSSRELDAD